MHQPIFDGDLYKASSIFSRSILKSNENPISWNFRKIICFRGIFLTNINLYLSMHWQIWLLIAITIYLLVSLLLYFIQEWIIFRPEKLSKHFKYKFDYPFEEYFFEPEKGVSINGLHFKLPQSKGVVFYFKGNSRSIKGWSKFARDFLGKGYDIFMIDYRGFGKSIGKRSEAGIIRDAQFVYDFLKSKYPEEKITIYGRSIGSGFATKIASENNPNRLILDSPYFSFLHLMRRYLPIFPVSKILKYHIRTDLYINEVSCPIFIIHGTRDWQIPFSNSKKLAKKSSRVILIPIEDASHNNLPRFAAYHDHLYAILHNVTRAYSYNGGQESSYL